MPDYFELSEFRLLPQMVDTSKYTDERIEAAAAYVTAIIEREVGTSFIARTVTAEAYDGGCGRILLRSPYVLSVTSATENGVAVTDPLTIVDGELRRTPVGSYTPVTWATGTSNVVVTYEAGYSAAPPADIKEAAMQATRYRLLATNPNAELSARQTSLTNDVGATIQFSVAGTDRPTGYPDVDAVIVGWRTAIRVPGVAIG